MLFPHHARLNIGYDGNKSHYLFAELCGWVEAADGFYLVSVKFNPVRHLVCKRINVDDTSANSKLSGFIYKVSALKCVFIKELHEEVNGVFFTDAYFDGVAFERFFGDYPFMYSFRIGDNGKVIAAFVDAGEYFGALQYEVVVGLVELIWFFV